MNPIARSRTYLVLFFLCYQSIAFAFYNPAAGRWLSRDPIGEVGGKNVYAFVENAPNEHIDAFGLITRGQCRDMIGNALESARIENLIGLLEKDSCPLPEIICSCCERFTIKSPGGYLAEDGKIHVCLTALTTDQSAFTTLVVHEHVHALQRCRKFRQGDDCSDRACRELQAYANDGSCDGLTGNLRNACIVQGAAGSLEFVPECGDNRMQLAWDALNGGCSQLSP